MVKPFGKILFLISPLFIGTSACGRHVGGHGDILFDFLILGLEGAFLFFVPLMLYLTLGLFVHRTFISKKNKNPRTLKIIYYLALILLLVADGGLVFLFQAGFYRDSHLIFGHADLAFYCLAGLIVLANILLPIFTIFLLRKLENNP